MGFSRVAPHFRSSFFAANGDGVIAFEEFAAWWCTGDPKDNLATLRKAISIDSSAEDGGTNEPFKFTLDAANASMVLLFSFCF